MNVWRPLCRAMACLVVPLALLGSQGCSKRLIGAAGLGEATANYWADRGTDLLDIVDVGITFSETARFAVYADELSLLPLGYGVVDGYAFGIGGGNIGWMCFSSCSAGVLGWGYEGLGFGDYDNQGAPAGNAQGVGIGGLVTGPPGRPGWLFSSVHQLHLTWVGAYANANWVQAIDLALGIVGIDICGDDGYRYGLWPWEAGFEPSAYAAEVQKQIAGPPSQTAPTYGSMCLGRSLSPSPGPAK
ncbi:MAG TPA: hypothetical protein PLE19_23195 [Planctomycetota bacterium]|nr:hypothetical protein [Planctomycetota bacterium]HRR83000.1 hypothetical protein [Planctomycetota bacterium]HRT96848.1 hypothetical protein [Planctomycetota bacterium]